MTGQIKPDGEGYRLTVKASGNGRTVQIDRWAPTRDELIAMQGEALELVGRMIEEVVR